MTVPRNSHPAASDRAHAFSLTELLVVIAIIGIVAAVGLPAAKNFNRGNLSASASRQLLDDLQNARQRAIASRSDVYVLFVPRDAANLLTDTSYTGRQLSVLSNAVMGQYGGYALYSPRSVGDQPGQAEARYLTSWKTLPQGTLIPRIKYDDVLPAVHLNSLSVPLVVESMPYTTGKVPFPTEDSPVLVNLPYVGFDYQGRLIGGRDEVIPIAEGGVDVAKDAAGRLRAVPGIPFERPTNNNWIVQPTVVRVDWLTGRSRVEKLEVK